MKKSSITNILKRSVLAASVITLAGCDLTDTNNNPNASSEVSVSAVLTGAEVVLGFSLGVDAGLVANIYIQQVAGANGDAASFDNYTTSPGYFNSSWANFYTNVLDELQIVQRTATAQQLPYYSGIARVLTAYSYGTLTDLFGDIPYKEALNGNSVTNPKYDGQADIYKDLQAQLDTAITELSKPVSANLGATPFTDDVIFKGNIANWLATAYTLKARYAIHLSKANPQEAAKQVLAALYNAGVYRGVPSNAADAQVVFGSSATNANPYYQQNTYRPGWIGLGASFVNLLNGNKVTDAPTTPEGQNVDPRRAYFATPSSGTTYRGSAPGVPGAFSRIGSYYGAATAPVILISYSEAKFLEAEARSILNPADPLAQTALEAAVKASFAKVISGTGDAYATPQKQAEYITAKATLTGNATKDLETIITQKYIALFLQPEVWSDYRRTGYPAIPLAANATHSANPAGQIPRRIPYPQREQSLNKNTPANSTYQQPKLWWDQ
ncbi:SusD/RagB family nutrient-binding outer membrane lipoprotein [Paraflavitalea sp. CAU 1676]|uniref:SusD/RagB family nutrient-binding outer membrane lipoprotein n=1 Tax=Paraflavitalea sp. CAU 1676 TaxID=3032598 RepID=UPI0023DBBE00|nr:SusD/RagB family nutrient-binding outer membrane lipoprotein [Paraflavitalea sp. CAU 1676]MDF2192339.1 SusD/RagB family nutrient-binding outer membrane lipoprotein [Paraflavitalea sp. CAU 1676]